ncbi:MAG: hypothetical protein LBG45_09025 [Dysgonamonadaceae bacterium]|nr:hypothetical protein [Dysgonamonadaceae bacterium]
MLKRFNFICVKVLLMVILATKFSDCRSQVTLGSDYILAKYDYFDVRVVDGFYEKIIRYDQPMWDDRPIYGVTYYVYKLFDDVIPQVYVQTNMDLYYGYGEYTKLEWREFCDPPCDYLGYSTGYSSSDPQGGVGKSFRVSKLAYTYIDESDYDEVNPNSRVYDSLGRLRGTWSANSLQSGEIGIVVNKLKGYKFIKR